MNLSFTTTALARPDILQQTYNSFDKYLDINLKKYDLHINIDPLPNKSCDKEIQECIIIAKRYFKKVYSYLGFGNFPMALYTVWDKANTEYIFHLEDDWELLEPIIVESILPEIPCYQTCLRAYPNFKNNNQVPYRFSLSPSIIDRAYKIFIKKLQRNHNPEQLLREYCRRNSHYCYRHVNIYPKEEERIIIKDIGSLWRENHQYTLDSQQGNWTGWIPSSQKH